MLQQAGNAFPDVLATALKSLLKEMFESGKLLCCFTDIVGKTEHPHAGHDFILSPQTFPPEHLGNALDNAGASEEAKRRQRTPAFPKIVSLFHN